MTYSESFVARVIQNFPLSQDPVLFDIGANNGKYTMPMAQRSRHVYAFEPHPVYVRMLNETIHPEHIPNITVVQKAMGNMIGESKLYVHRRWGMHTTRQASAETGKWDHSLDLFLDIEMTTIDNFIQEEKLTKLDLIKVDVEGAEEDVFRGGEQTFRTMHPAIIAELHGGVDLNWIYRFFSNFNYEFYDTKSCICRKLKVDHHYLIVNKDIRLPRELLPRLAW